MIALVHLVWAPLGLEPVRSFLRSYADRQAGARHELVVLLNGASVSHGNGDSFRAGLLEELSSTPHRLIELDRPVLDLAAYGAAAQLVEHETICFCNSYSVILVDGWLALLASALAAPDVGLAGATGSWESQSEWQRGPLRWWPYQLLRLPFDRRRYPRYPDPHLRTTGFIAARETILGLGLERVASKRDAYLMESGFCSITRRVQADGLQAVVVGRDGCSYQPSQWPQSSTYRSGGQRNLLITDNRTRDWQLASPRLRRRLAGDAWGAHASI